MSGGKGKGGEGKSGKEMSGKGKGGKGKGKGGKGKGGKGKGGKGKGGKGKGGKGKGDTAPNGQANSPKPSAPVPTPTPVTVLPPQTNSPKPTTPVPTTPAPVIPLPLEEQNNLVTCVSVIDENNGNDQLVDADWLAFRARYPDRPFCLLRPPNTLPLSKPSTFDNDKANIFANVTRDGLDADPATRSDWFTLCKMADSRARGLTNVVLYVDNSGSMYTFSVKNAHDAFQAAVVAAGMQVVKTDYKGHENYILPCNGTSLVGT
jgi:hypothetical protein